MPYFSFYMAFHGISDPECKESEVQITSTSLSKHFASMFAYKKSEFKKPGNGWCAWVFSGASIPFGKYGCGGRIWTDGLRVMRCDSFKKSVQSAQQPLLCGGRSLENERNVQLVTRRFSGNGSRYGSKCYSPGTVSNILSQKDFSAEISATAVSQIMSQLILP